MNQAMTLPLQDCHILVTRPRAQADALAQALAENGAIPICLPTIAIQSVPEDQIHVQRERIANTDMLIFISQNAVEHAWPILVKWQIAHKKNVSFAAVGAGTAQALRAYGVKQIICPETPPYNSETLLALPALQAQTVSGKAITIVRGVGGRELIANTLSARGATLTMMEVYQRARAQAESALLASLWSTQAIDVVLTTSRDNLQFLFELLPANKHAQLTNTPLVVISDAMVALAKNLGFCHILRARGADTAAMIDCLKEWRKL